MTELAKRPQPNTDEHGPLFLLCRETCSPFRVWRDFTKVALFALVMMALFAGPVAVMRFATATAHTPTLAETQAALCQMTGELCGQTITGSVKPR